MPEITIFEERDSSLDALLATFPEVPEDDINAFNAFESDQY